MKGLLTAKKLGFRVLIAFIVLLAIMLACSLIGSRDISLIKALSGQYINGQINADYQIFMQVRIPRVLIAALVGAALAGAGVIFQALLRNSLAEPYLLGISSGAGLGAILAVVYGFSWTIAGRSPIAVFSFFGALATVWLVWGLGRCLTKSSITGLILVGVVVNAFLSAFIMFITSIAKSQQVHSTIFWLMGNIREEDYFIIWISIGCIVSGIVAMFYLSPQLNVLSFGESDAKQIGINPRRVQIAAFSIAAFITAIAVSLSGLVGFIGLIIPHTVRLIFGPDHRQLTPLSAIFGAGFLVLADTLSRVIIAPAQLPVGVITALTGGPFFLILLVKYMRKTGWADK